ncbi:MAG: elongation factor P maturation arginine rhamnosyltransferase EarP [Rhodocyclaceae bacterium]|jgi:uncharacterized repeat protein (TIGR03837 family)|nr:elongation factor P maturation arginine rhamnosyltransferase EarP [Rhodocyclaceae bacterium]
MPTQRFPLDARWALFCKVIDNFGDIGVCWRLARTLARDHGQRVTLWVDDPEALFALCPSARSTEARFLAEGVEVRRWDEPFEASCAEDTVADIVVEAFSCDPPAAYVEAMAQRAPHPVWINLEYLSAEDWVEGCHGMVSPHPRLPLVKHFFFPGFSTRTGGLLREPGLLDERARFEADPALRADFLHRLGVPGPDGDALTISLFGYGHPQIASLLQAWIGSARPVRVLVPEGRMVPQIAQALGLSETRAGTRWRGGALELVVLPFVPQTDYDRLLWSCGLNFVRGEDSFVRAQWAARPFVWQIYPQPDDAHRTKLDAFLNRYTHALAADLRAPLTAFWHAWNGDGDPGACWDDFASALTRIAGHDRAWSAALAQHEDLATALAKFCQAIVK